MTRFAVNQERLLETFLRLLRIPSLSGREGAVAHLVAASLGELGLTVERDQAHLQFGGEAGNVIARLPGPGPPILVCAHLDTVGPGDHISPRVSASRITSDGTTILGADDKAAVAGILEAVRVVLEQSLPHAALELVFTVAEEVGLKGAKALDLGRLRSRLAYVADSEGRVGTMINRAPGQDSIKAVLTGKAAHAGVAPEKGVNAIKMAGQALAAMRLGRLDEETTANIGLIRGGLATNIVPDRVELEGEARSHRDDKREAQVQHMVECLHEAAAQMGGKVEVEITPMYRSFHIPETHPVVRLGRLAMRQVGLRPRLQATGGGSDANVFNEHGMAAVLLGVGYRDCHTKREYIPLAQLHKFAQLMVALLTAAARM